MDADGGQHERHAGEQPEHEHGEPAFRDRSRHRLGERLESEDGQRRILLPDDLSDACRIAVVSGRPHEQHTGAGRRRRLIERRVDRDRRCLREALEALVADDPDDCPARAPEADLLAERLLFLEEAPRGGFVDEHDRRRRVVSESASRRPRTSGTPIVRK